MFHHNVSSGYIVFIFLAQVFNSHCYHDSTETVGFSASQRTDTDDLSGVNLIPDADQTLTSGGLVIAFNYYSEVTEVDVRFQIWRPAGGNDYELVYQTETITTNDTETGSFTYNIDEPEMMEEGDTIGIYFDSDNPIPYESSPDCTLMVNPLRASSSASVGDESSFSTVTSSECRAYSVHALVVYDTVDAASLTCMNLTAEDSYQSFTSTNYDGSTNYLDSTHDCWFIDSGDSGKGVRVLFESLDFQVEYVSSGECALDFLEFHDGEDFWQVILDELCGTTYPEFGMNSTQRYMWIRMVSNDDGINGLGFQMQYKTFDLDDSSEDKKKKDEIDVAVVLCIVFAIIALLLIIPIVVLWVKTKRQRDVERRDKLKDNDFLELESSRPSAWSPEPPRTARAEPVPNININEHREQFMKSKQGRRVPEAPDYHKPRQPEGSESVKIKHWSKLTAGVRWNPIRKQFRVGDTPAPLHSDV